MAKLIIRLINGIAEVGERRSGRGRPAQGRVLPELQRARTRRPIYPAADLSEQISTAGKEASGTGNMKFTLNGALTIGTLDGANVEIREEVGEENFFLFGLTAEQVQSARAGGYRPRAFYDEDRELRAVLDMIGDGTLSAGDAGLFRPMVDQLLDHDDFMLLADYRAYIEAQAAAERAFRDRQRWTRMSILNTARSGRFSSDRAIHEYCEDIWGAQRVPPGPKEPAPAAR